MNLSFSYRSPVSQARLIAFLNKLSDFPRFDAEQPVRLFLSSDNTFAAVESVFFSWTFTSFDHKLIELLESPNNPITLPFRDFYAFVTSC